MIEQQASSDKGNLTKLSSNLCKAVQSLCKAVQSMFTPDPPVLQELHRNPCILPHASLPQHCDYPPTPTPLSPSLHTHLTQPFTNDSGWQSRTHLSLWNRDHALVQSLCAKLLWPTFVQRGALHTVQSKKKINFPYIIVRIRPLGFQTRGIDSTRSRALKTAISSKNLDFYFLQRGGRKMRGSKIRGSPFFMVVSN